MLSETRVRSNLNLMQQVHGGHSTILISELFNINKQWGLR